MTTKEGTGGACQERMKFKGQLERAHGITRFNQLIHQIAGEGAKKNDKFKWKTCVCSLCDGCGHHCFLLTMLIAL